MSIRERPFLRQVQHVHPDARDPRTAAVRQQIRRDFGMLVPPFALHLPVPDALSACWAIVREPTHGRRVDRATKEAVAAAVSATNTCPYCVDVHTTTLPRWASPPRPRPSPPGSPTPSPTRACTPWSPGRATRHSDAPILRQRPFPDEHAPELIGVALAYHYINRMVNIFAAASPFPVATPTLKPLMKRIAAPAFRRLLAREVHPGASLDLLPPAPLPDDLAWARGDPVIAAHTAAPPPPSTRPAARHCPSRCGTWSPPGSPRGAARSQDCRAAGSTAPSRRCPHHSSHRGGSRCSPRSPPTRSTPTSSTTPEPAPDRPATKRSSPPPPGPASPPPAGSGRGCTPHLPPHPPRSADRGRAGNG